LLHDRTGYTPALERVTVLVELVERDRATVVRVLHRDLRLMMSPTNEPGRGVGGQPGQSRSLE
jgi:hypothetical protein